jgi:hypothetical protein
MIAMEHITYFSARESHSVPVTCSRLLCRSEQYACGGARRVVPRPWNAPGVKGPQRARAAHIRCLGNDFITVDPHEVQRAVDGLVASQVALPLHVPPFQRIS